MPHLTSWAFGRNRGRLVGKPQGGELIYGLPGHSVKPFADSRRNHWDERPAETSIRYLILHLTTLSFEEVVDCFTSQETSVSAHYIVSEFESDIRPGLVVQMVPEQKKAWHAGESLWKNERALNNTSIGIEVINPTTIPEQSLCSKTLWVPFHQIQIDTLGQLARSIIKKYAIAPLNVLGHSDVAPCRKLDPGPLFPWGYLFHQYGVGGWLEDNEIGNPQLIHQRYAPHKNLSATEGPTYFFDCLRAIGYGCEGWEQDATLAQGAIRAFKMHFSANQDPQESASPQIRPIDRYWAWALAAKYTGAE